MPDVKRLIPAADQSAAHPVIHFGGDIAHVNEWPVNPAGDFLLLLLTIDCRALQAALPRPELPDCGYLQVFSTYKRDDYFLDDICCCGTAEELERLRSGYTRVVYSLGETPMRSPVASMPRLNMQLQDYRFGDDEFCVASLLADKAPRGVRAAALLEADHVFFCQIYSADFPAPFEDALYLSDAVGCLFLRRDPVSSPVDGLFLVHTG